MPPEWHCLLLFLIKSSIGPSVFRGVTILRDSVLLGSDIWFVLCETKH